MFPYEIDIALPSFVDKGAKNISCLKIVARTVTRQQPDSERLSDKTPFTVSMVIRAYCLLKCLI